MFKYNFNIGYYELFYAIFNNPSLPVPPYEYVSKTGCILQLFYRVTF